jgi:hypothetical protein
MGGLVGGVTEDVSDGEEVTEVTAPKVGAQHEWIKCWMCGGCGAGRGACWSDGGVGGGWFKMAVKNIEESGDLIDEDRLMRIVIWNKVTSH